MNIIFFGSTSDSVIVLENLYKFVIRNSKFVIVAVVTQPPKPVGRMREITKTPVEIWASKNHIPVISFANNEHNPWLYKDEDDAVNTLSTFKPELLVSASYGQKIPLRTVAAARFGGLNIHPSLLPRWRGADPVPWTILSGDRQTGVSIVTLSPEFDRGYIIAQKKIPVVETDQPDELRMRLFSLGADLLVETLPDYISGKNKGVGQKQENAAYARKLTRDDGFIPWNTLITAMEGNDTPKEKRPTLLSSALPASPIGECLLPSAILRILRALSPWPGIWTLIRIKDQGSKIKDQEKRLKILSAHLDHEKLILDTVQLEGKNPVDWETFQRAHPK